MSNHPTSSSAPRKPHRLLPSLHFLALLAMAAACFIVFLRESPAPEVFRRISRRRPASGAPFDGLARTSHALTAAIRVAAPDLIFGAAALLLFGIGSGVYVRRLDLWIRARASGDAVSFGADTLEDQAIAANDPKRRQVPTATASTRSSTEKAQ